ncbi:hypothetical protein CDD83_8657 [Cordyceps sp. RAO-2017]|nr:hypothetical protein CDD83_8657 [Cordyceps sp. RAO-2017]
MAAAAELAFLACLRETCRPVLARRTGAVASPPSSSSVGRVLESSLRPVIMLSGSGVLMAVCLFSGVYFSFAYIISVTLPDILETVYGQPLAVQGPAFLSCSVGYCLSVILCNRTLDRTYIRLRKANNGVGLPEFRLPLAIVGALSLPVAVLLYGCVPQLRLPLPVMLLSAALLAATLLLATLPTMAYVVDAFNGYPASAMTGLIFVRSLSSTFLPFLASPLITRFGYARGFGVLSALCLCLCPIPMLVMRYGPKWRQRSEYSRDA